MSCLELFAMNENFVYALDGSEVDREESRLGNFDSPRSEQRIVETIEEGEY